MNTHDAMLSRIEGVSIGRKNLIAGFWAMAGFMFLGFVLVYLRDFAPGAADWAAQYGTGRHFETRLAHVHGTLFGFLNVVVEGEDVVGLPKHEDHNEENKVERGHL